MKAREGERKRRRGGGDVSRAHLIEREKGKERGLDVDKKRNLGRGKGLGGRCWVVGPTEHPFEKRGWWDEVVLVTTSAHPFGGERARGKRNVGLDGGRGWCVVVVACSFPSSARDESIFF